VGKRLWLLLFSLLLGLNASVAAGDVVVLLPAGDAERVMHEEIAQRYMKEHPSTNIVFQYVVGSGQTLEKAMTMIAAGIAPDLMYMSPTALEVFAAVGAVVDLFPWVDKTGTDLSILHPQALAGYQMYYPGQLLGMPRLFLHHAMFYNADMFNERGMVPPGYGTHWNDFTKAVGSLTRDTDGDGKFDKFGFWMRGWYRTPTYFMPLLHAFGGSIFNADRSGSALLKTDTVRMFESIFDIFRRYEPPFSTTAIQNLQRTSQLAMWYDLNTAMLTYDFSFAWGVAPLPAEKNGHGIGLYDVGLAMLSASKNKAEAWDFLQYVISYEAQKIAAEHGFIPVRKDVVSEGNLFATLPKSVQSTLLRNIMSANVNSLALLAGPHYSTVNQILGDGLLNLKNEAQLPVRNGLVEMDRLINNTLAQPWPLSM
jgi:ABC-type glycerol-3-phosphate transport system substrate-binding protein